MGFASFILQLVGSSLAAWYISTRLLADILPIWVLNHAQALSFGFVALVMLVDRFYIYSNFRSPLRKHPRVLGSPAKLITEIPRGSTPLKWMKEFPDADMVVMQNWFGGERILPISPRALRDIMSTNTYDFEKPKDIVGFLARIIGYGLILSEGALHKKGRKSLTPAFNIRNIRSLYTLMWDKTGILLSQLEGEMATRGQVEMSAWGSRFTLDIIGPAALSRDFRSMSSNDHQIADAFSSILEPSRDMLIFLALQIITPQWFAKHIPMRANKVVEDNTRFLRNLCGSILKEKHQALSEKKDTAAEETDILSNIINSGDFSDDEIVDQMLTMLAAGHETTAGAITWTCYLLSQRPHIQSALRAEIHATIPTSSSPITHDVLESMPYLNGVCEEVLRLFPSVPSSLRTTIRRSTIADTVIPRDSVVILPIYAVNRNPAFWGPDADEMVPERWIDTAADGTKRCNKHGGTSSNYCEITFLHGQRSCIGRDFAKAELRCGVAGIFGRFVVEMVDPEQEITVSGSVTTKPREGMHLKLKTVEGW